MEKKKSRFFVKLIAMILVTSLCAPIGAQAAVPKTVQPRESVYLWKHTAYVCAMGGGDLEIWFEVLGTGTLAEIGVLKVYLYESADNVDFDLVKTYKVANYPNMLWYNNPLCTDHVDYEGVPGRYYKVYVCVWGGDGNTGDARYIWSEVERCT